jgi:hypothetical protein
VLVRMLPVLVLVEQLLEALVQMQLPILAVAEAVVATLSLVVLVVLV